MSVTLRFSLSRLLCKHACLRLFFSSCYPSSVTAALVVVVESRQLGDLCLVLAISIHLYAHDQQHVHGEFKRRAYRV